MNSFVKLDIDVGTIYDVIREYWKKWTDLLNFFVINEQMNDKQLIITSFNNGNNVFHIMMNFIQTNHQICFGTKRSRDKVEFWLFPSFFLLFLFSFLFR